MKQASEERLVDRAYAKPRAGSAPRHSPEEPRQRTVREVGRSLIEGRWLLLGSVVLAGALAAAYLAVAPPVYRSGALLQVEEPAEGGSRLEVLPALNERRGSVESEIEILRSRSIVGSVVDQLRLDVEVLPRHFPIVGGALSLRHRGAEPSRPPLPLAFLTRFAWGGERIAVARLQVPEALLDVPLTLTALPEGRYLVTTPDGDRVAEGPAGGAPGTGWTVPGLDLLVTELVARPDTEFTLRKHGREDVVSALREQLYAQEQGKDTGIVGLELEGPDPVQVAGILSALCDKYLRDNLERSVGEAARTLVFLEAQLPEHKASLERAEQALSAFRRRAGTVSLPLEAKATVERAADLDKTVTELQNKLLQLRQRYSDQHPEVIATARALDAARLDQGGITPQVTRFPDTQLIADRLARDVAVASDLYLMLLHRARELRVVKSGRNGSARLVDPPFAPQRPLRPRAPLVLAVALLLGLAGGVAVALARRALDESAEDPQAIEAATGLPMFLALPHSEREAQLHRGGGRRGRVPLALDAPADVATETLRALRSALAFLLKARPRVVVVSSPSPGVGKTFVCTNLAHLSAAAGQRVLLVDGDLRRGELHRHLASEQAPGLADVVQGQATFEEAVRATGTAGLDLLPCGRIPRYPSELLASPRLQEILQTASARYDLVIVDTPPILAVADAIPLARAGALTLMVLRARQHSISEISVALDRFARSGVRIHGGILNDSRPASGAYGRVYEHRSAVERGDGRRAP